MAGRQERMKLSAEESLKRMEDFANRLPLIRRYPMSATLQAFGIDRLSVAQRILLVEEIWDSIAAEAENLPITDAQKQDLQRRLAAYEANRHAGSTWSGAVAAVVRGVGS